MPQIMSWVFINTDDETCVSITYSTRDNYRENTHVKHPWYLITRSNTQVDKWQVEILCCLASSSSWSCVGVGGKVQARPCATSGKGPRREPSPQQPAAAPLLLPSSTLPPALLCFSLPPLALLFPHCCSAKFCFPNNICPFPKYAGHQADFSTPKIWKAPVFGSLPFSKLLHRSTWLSILSVFTEFSRIWLNFFAFWKCASSKVKRDGCEWMIITYLVGGGYTWLCTARPSPYGIPSLRIFPVLSWKKFKVGKEDSILGYWEYRGGHQAKTVRSLDSFCNQLLHWENCRSWVSAGHRAFPVVVGSLLWSGDFRIPW